MRVQKRALLYRLTMAGKELEKQVKLLKKSTTQAQLKAKDLELKLSVKYSAAAARFTNQTLQLTQVHELNERLLSSEWEGFILSKKLKESQAAVRQLLKEAKWSGEGITNHKVCLKRLQKLKEQLQR
ncbi:unnamed protein product [Caretta caretta]